jgi:aminoglycoside phosphotransferase (APT) family kinase protein
VASSILGTPVDAVEQVPSSAVNQVFRVEAGDTIAFVKCAPEPVLRREVAVLDVVRALDVPVPEVIGASWTDVPCIVVRAVRGRPVDGDDPAFASAGALLTRVHGVTLAGFGAVVADGDALRGEDASWSNAIARRCAGMDAVVEAGLVDRSLVDRALASVAAAGDAIAAVDVGHLLHGDFHPRHVYANAGAVAAIIDWGDATIGDPRYDLGRIVHAALMTEGDIDAGLARVERVADAVDERVVLAYAIVFALWSMATELAGGAPWEPWWPLQHAAVEQLLARLDPSGRAVGGGER